MPSHTILVVDDDYFMRTGLCAYLEDLGYTVIEAGHAAEALARARATQPAAAVTP